ncbi:TPA: iron-sulfur cluster insertion protein ErpA [Candidatus Woesearchaeota archaeon]|nr:iron-sulfur cluster insertion protein ErpA [Candidatus Woesearchaeota archaeon]
MNAAVNITQKAADKVMQIIQQKKKEGYGLRLGIVEGGCSGFEYSIVLDDKTNDDDTVVEQKGVKVFVDNKSMEFLRGSLIDYVDTMQGAGFKISNPNAQHSCGCGNSFG